MLRILRGIGWSLLALLGLLVAVWLAARFWPLSAEQRAQVRLLEDVQPLPGRNGFALLWTLPFDDLDAAQRERALLKDVERWRAGPVQGMTDSLLEGTQPQVKAQVGVTCGSRIPDCLARVRADPQRFIDAHAGHGGLHARQQQLDDFDRFDSPFLGLGDPLMMPVPRYQLLMEGTSAHALAFVQGDTAAALAGSCRSLQLGRRLMHRGGTLLDSMIGAASVQVNAQLLADMLVELPADHALPAVCETALQPLANGEQSLCRAMQGEFALNERAIDASLRQGANVLMLDRSQTRARIAQNFAWACGAAAERRLTEDAPAQRSWEQPWDVRCVANWIGCTLASISGPAYQDYAARSQDSAALVRLLGAQRWLRQQPDAPAQALARLPAQWRSPSRVPTLSADGHHLQVARRQRDATGELTTMLSVPL
ncbi:hypothetical protein [Stenotrophomonas sp. YAU14D1_LEIMI4_1]|uniref:hypothetical protein n=1 Tax=Stenotrophomonas sp. YAU14D1_LEIMI4_1 TaxID=2072407 RepID=UPI000D53CB7C|nr:hypothetical protein [Stenotrophomonas sp. YAU14D1_LEIMI4_1]AWH26126.1 hypothetical protein C1932_14025 [Stenotrophomonas sp. YAU14D1_LEIMI4_1]